MEPGLQKKSVNITKLLDVETEFLILNMEKLVIQMILVKPVGEKVDVMKTVNPRTFLTSQDSVIVNTTDKQ